MDARRIAERNRLFAVVQAGVIWGFRLISCLYLLGRILLFKPVYRHARVRWIALNLRAFRMGVRRGLLDSGATIREVEAITATPRDGRSIRACRPR